MSKVLPFPTPKRERFVSVPGEKHLKRHVVTGIYYVRKKKVGRAPLFKSTGEHKVTRARHVADQLIAEWLGKTPADLAPRQRTIAELIPELMLELEALGKSNQRRAATLRGDLDKFKPIEKYFGYMTPDEIDEEFWDHWVTHTGRGLGITLFDMSKYLSKILTFAKKKKLIRAKPVIRNPDPKKETGHVYTDAEVREILKHAGERLLLQITLGYECALRTGEVSRMEWSMLDIGRDRVAYTLPEWLVKANAREIYLSPETSKRLIAWQKVAPKSRYVFPAPKDPTRHETRTYQNRLWRKAMLAAVRSGGLSQEARFYDLRHTFYNRALFELGLPIQSVSAYGGTSIRTLQKVYLKPTAQSTQAISVAVELPRLGPKKGKRSSS